MGFFILVTVLANTLVLYGLVDRNAFFATVIVILVLLLFLLLDWKNKKQLVVLLVLFAAVATLTVTRVYVFNQHLFSVNQLKKTQTLRVQIVTLPAYHNHHWQFIGQLNQPEERVDHQLLMLNWYGHYQVMREGQVWQFTGHIKPLQQIRNTSYHNWLVAKHIIGVTYIKTGQQITNAPIRYHFEKVDQIRYYLLSQLKYTIGASDTVGVISAITLGIHSDITKKQWLVFRQTGTNHLVAVAGLHLGMLVSFIMIVCKMIGKQYPKLFFYYPRQRISLLLALIIGGAYAVLAGLSLPTKRALVMLSCFSLSQLTGRYLPFVTGVCSAVMLMVVSNPLVALTSSYWLSFFAIGLIVLACSGRLLAYSHYRSYFRIQTYLTLGLSPICLYFFHQTSLIAILANCIAIPWLLLIILPLSLLGVGLLMINMNLAKLLLHIVAFNVDYLLKLLSFFGSLPWATITLNQIPPMILFNIMMGIVLLLIPKGLAGRHLGFLCILPVILSYIK